MKRVGNIKLLESLIYIILWMTVYILTIIFTYNNGIKWDRTFFEWARLSPFLLIFLMNNFIFTPYLLFNKKYVSYVLFLVIAIVLTTYLRLLVGKLDPLPGTGRMVPPEFENFPPEPIHRREPGLMVIIFNNISIALLIVGFNTGIKLFVKRILDENKQSELEQQQLKTELAFLKYQISPHFFMNTLNNIHSLIDINSEDAKDAVIKLSGLMRYLLYESEESGKSSLNKEIEFISNYLELMQLRFDLKILEINFSPPKVDNDIIVPPLIFLSFIENAFKHGISYKEKSTIDISIQIINGKLNFSILNRLFPGEYRGKNESSGVGLENVRKRLDLIYGDQYKLEIKEDKKKYTVRLQIPTQ